MSNPIINTYNFDICFICFNEPLVDARTINIAKLTARKGKNVALIAFGSEVEKRYYKSFNINFFPIEKSKHQKVSVRWSKFKLDTNKLKGDINAKFYYACDLYSLPVASDMKKAMRFMGAQSRLYYDSREIYSQLGPLSGHSLKQVLISKIEKMYIKEVDKIITTGKGDTEFLLGYFNTSAPYVEIMNLPPYQTPKHTDLLRVKADLSYDTLILIYQGMILKGRGLKIVIDAISNIENVHLFIVGAGEYYQDLAQYVIDKGMSKKVTFTGRVPYSRLLDITASADVGLCLFEPISVSYELALPNKLFEYIMAGIPTIATNLPQIQRVINKNKVGVLVDSDLKINDVINAIEKVRDLEVRKKMIEQAKLVAKDYSYESQTEKILKMFPQ